MKSDKPEMTGSNDHTDSSEDAAASLVELWREYGKRFTVLVPEQQPVPEVWDPQVPETDDKGRTNPQYLKHWKFLDRTKEFLRDHYSDYGILEGPSLYFNCLVPKFQDRMLHRWALDQSGDPTAYPVNENRSWYHKAIRMGIFRRQIGFSCRSVLCERHWCRLHRENPNRINPVDIYGLIGAFENISLTAAKTRLGKWWGVRLGDLNAEGIQETRRSRHRVPKKAILDLLNQHSNMRTQHVGGLIRDLVGLIRTSPLVEWHGRMFDEDHSFFSKKVTKNLFRINNPAAKAYVWLLIGQLNMSHIFCWTPCQFGVYSPANRR